MSQNQGMLTQEMQRAFHDGLLIPGVVLDDDALSEYKAAFRIWGGEDSSCVHWTPCGAGIHIFQNSMDSFLLKAIFSQDVDLRDDAGDDHRAKITKELQAAMRIAVPTSASARIAIESFTSTTSDNGTQFRARAFGIVTMTVPIEIVEFMLAKGIEVVSGERSKGAAEQVYARERLHLEEPSWSYNIWHVNVRLIADPTKTCRVMVERPLNLAKPMLVTGLDFDDCRQV